MQLQGVESKDSKSIQGIDKKKYEKIKFYVEDEFALEFEEVVDTMLGSHQWIYFDLLYYGLDKIIAYQGLYIEVENDMVVTETKVSSQIDSQIRYQLLDLMSKRAVAGMGHLDILLKLGQKIGEPLDELIKRKLGQKFKFGENDLQIDHRSSGEDNENLEIVVQDKSKLYAFTPSDGDQLKPEREKVMTALKPEFEENLELSGVTNHSKGCYYPNKVINRLEKDQAAEIPQVALDGIDDAGKKFYHVEYVDVEYEDAWLSETLIPNAILQALMEKKRKTYWFLRD